LTDIPDTVMAGHSQTLLTESQLDTDEVVSGAGQQLEINGADAGHVSGSRPSA
jgi:hypothetical protein